MNKQNIQDMTEARNKKIAQVKARMLDQGFDKGFIARFLGAD